MIPKCSPNELKMDPMAPKSQSKTPSKSVQKTDTKKIQNGFNNDLTRTCQGTKLNKELLANTFPS